MNAQAAPAPWLASRSPTESEALSREIGRRPSDPGLDALRRLPWIPQVDLAHSVQVTWLALTLFDALAEPLALSPSGRDILAASAFWHDCGQAIGEQGHHKHSYALIMALELPQWELDVQRRVACIARYHRKRPPRPGDRGYECLDHARQRQVRQLSALLRIADGLDYSHRGLAHSLGACVTDRQLRLEVGAPMQADTELRRAQEKADLFQTEFGCGLALYREEG
ncbi:MAG TPA: HD domain-containing protein [Chloroflexota bacterium]|nr:HD domain-containing protein [Chloroflexota bacterium]